MDNGLQLSPLTRLLALNTEISELRTALMHQPVASGRIAELQDSVDFRCRASLATCWLAGDYELEEEEEDDDLEGLARAE